MMFTSILVGVDRSQHAQVALTQAVDIARTQKASLTVLVAYSTLMPWGPVSPLPQGAVDEFVAGVRSDAQAIADEAKSAIPPEVSAEVLVVDSAPAQAIIDRAAAGNHDLIVVGSRGRGDAGSFLLGSVSHAVLSHSRVPVLIVHVPSVEDVSRTA
jgi:nucleotide-binding universal stress UspA family protein